jgi:F-type H+-transporting ATPase subunit a
MLYKNILQIATPLDQFEIRDYIMIDAPILGNIHISLTNLGLYITTAFVIIVIMLGVVNKLPKFIYRS